MKGKDFLESSKAEIDLAIKIRQNKFENMLNTAPKKAMEIVRGYHDWCCYQDARKCCEQLLQSKELKALSSGQLVQLYLLMADILEHGFKEFKAALDWLNKALELTKKEGEGSNTYASIILRMARIQRDDMGEYSQALANIEKVNERLMTSIGVVDFCENLWRRSSDCSNSLH